MATVPSEVGCRVSAEGEQDDLSVVPHGDYFHQMTAEGTELH